MSITGKKRNSHETYNNYIRASMDTNVSEVGTENSAAIIVYTSGSTGTPKGVVLSNRNLNAIAIICYMSGKNHQPGDKFLNILPPFFSFGIGMLHLALYTGMTEIAVIVPKNREYHKND